jgi:hypothetical protein
MDWPSPLSSPCAPIPPGMVAPLSLLPTSPDSLKRHPSPFSLVLPSVSLALLQIQMCCSASLAPLQSRCAALLRSPLCFPSLTAQRSALQPPLSPSRSSRRWHYRVGDGSIKEANNRTDPRGDGGIKGTSACA